MDWLNSLGNWIADDRLLTNLIGLHLLLGLFCCAAVVLRRLLMHGGNQAARWTGLHWLDGISKEAAKHARTLLFWSTLALMALTIVGAIAYHVLGRDMRVDVQAWYNQLTPREILDFGLAGGELIFLGVAMFLGMRLVRRLNRTLESYALTHLPRKCPLGFDRIGPDGAPCSEQEHKERHEHNVKHWFHLLERFAICSVVLTTIWSAGHIVHLGNLADTVIGFSIRMLAIFMVSRLLILACRTLSHALGDLGNRHLGESKFTRYWERVTRLFPFGEKCFEAAVYISAAWLCVYHLEFIRALYDPTGEKNLGPNIVQCIGIFFITRVIIELSSVLLNEAFGMYREDRPIDQMGKTLVPLLQSVCQYGLYFGSGLMMMGVMGLPTTSVLAGASILGLACGLGGKVW